MNGGIRIIHIIYYSFLLASISALFTSCAVKQHQLLFENKTTAIAPASQPDATVTAYHIQPQDILQVRNLQNIRYIVDEAPTTTGGSSSANTAGQGQTYQVEEDGTVALPVIGHVQVSGLTRYEAAKQIESLYKKSLLKDPIIEVKITNLKVTMLGEVKAQGNYPLVKDQTTLIDLLGAAGGLTEKANEKNIKIIRGTGTNQHTTEIDLSDIRTLSDPHILLQNNDIVYVAQSKRAARTENLQNFSTLVQPALLLLNTALIIYSFSR